MMMLPHGRWRLKNENKKMAPPAILGKMAMAAAVILDKMATKMAMAPAAILDFRTF